jgi:hypothetical protein
MKAVKNIDRRAWMKKKLLIGLMTLGFTLGIFADVKNKDKPKLGVYDFHIQKIWQTDKVGQDFFGDIFTVVVSPDDKICCYDWKNLKYYILDSKGKLIHTFGQKGEGPGEIRRIEQAPIVNAGNKIAVLDDALIHFFNWQGKYIKTKRNITGNRPIVFLDEDNFISAPRSSLAVRDGMAKVERVNLKNGKRNLITTFSMYKGGVLRSRNGQAAVVFGGITPMAVVTFHQNHLYYGMNDAYKITITDEKGKQVNSFSLKRDKGIVKQKDIVQRLVERAKGRAPKELLERLAKTLPKEETYFTRILVHKGLIYVFKSEFYATNVIQIDIFSSRGEYLYQGILSVEKGYLIRNRIFTDRFLYLSLENEDGDNYLAKFKVTVPKGE